MKAIELLFLTLFILCVEGFFAGIFFVIGCYLPIKYPDGACIYSPLTAAQATGFGAILIVVSFIVGAYSFLFVITE
jgi:hypothetical protein